jgi:hypothetical protein
VCNEVGAPAVVPWAGAIEPSYRRRFRSPPTFRGVAREVNSVASDIYAPAREVEAKNMDGLRGSAAPNGSFTRWAVG